MDDLNITIEEYIRLKEEKARRQAIVFDDTFDTTLSCETTVTSLDNNKIDFNISFDESDDEDYIVVFDENSFSCKIFFIDNLKTNSKDENDKVNMPSSLSPEPTFGYIDDLDFFKDFENEFPTITYNDLKFKSNPVIEPFTNADIADFEARLTRIYRREVHRVQVFDLGGLPDLIAERLSTRMLMENKDAQGQTEEMQTAGFGLYWTESTRRIPNKGDLRDYWIRISSAGDFLVLEIICFRRKQGAMIYGCQYVSRLAEHFGLLTEERLHGLTAWVLARPARQDGDVREVVKEAPMAPGGGDEDEEMP
ncbi:hypothetical protein Tco_1296343 [Tanacetum coccineum]